MGYVPLPSRLPPRRVGYNGICVSHYGSTEATHSRDPGLSQAGDSLYDITTLLKDKNGLRGVIDRMSRHYRGTPVDAVIGIEARGFIFAPAVAYALGAGFVPVRKPKKLPPAAHRDLRSGIRNGHARDA